MIVTFNLYGRGFRPDSVVLAGSTISSDPMEKVVPFRFISERQLEVQIDTDDFADELIHLSVLQGPDGIRSATVTLNPRLAPTRTVVVPAPAVLAHSANSPVLVYVPPVATGPEITTYQPQPITARPQAMYVTFYGDGFVNGCTWQLTGPSGTQGGTCTTVSISQARTNFNPTTAGTHQMVITNPAPGGPSAPYSFQILVAVATELPVEIDPEG